LRAKISVLVPLVLLIFGGFLGAIRTLPAHGTTGPVAAFEYEPCLACAAPGFVAFFNASGSATTSGTLLSYTWDFGDGSIATSNSPSTWHDFFMAKSNVTLTVKDSGGLEDTVTQHFVWNVVPRFNFQPTDPGVNDPVLFNATSSNAYLGSYGVITDYAWSFGDNSQGSGVLVKHAYSSPGLFRVSLTLPNNGNNGDPRVSTTIQVRSSQTGQLLLNTVFDGDNVTVSGFFNFNSTIKTLSGQATVTVTNATNHELLFMKTFSISFTARSNGMIRFILVASISPFKLGVTCTTDSKNNTSSCFVSRNPDVDGDGTVDIIDFGMLAIRFGATTGSTNYMPAVDLSDHGTIDIIDAGIMATDFGAVVFQ